jgi:type II secretory pathway predicted ATPase ExeA
MKILTAESVMPEAYTAQTDDQINWFSLGFKATPFNNSHADSNLFFKSQALIYTLNKLCTLDTSETCTTFLVGQKGCGKSTCLRALKKIRSHYHSILLIGTSGLNPQNLLKTLMSDSSHLVELSRTPSTEDCISLLKSLSAQKQQIRLLIDNADQLPKETVSLIKKLSSIQPNGSQLQFVLCAEKKKMHADIAGDAQLKTQVVQLDNLTRLETEKYLALKLQLSTDSKRCPMIPKDYIDEHKETYFVSTKMQFDPYRSILMSRKHRLHSLKHGNSINAFFHLLYYHLLRSQLLSRNMPQTHKANRHYRASSKSKN